ncbi:hypothetical protein EDEG_03388 [Edhazardia aedis USNM 41457]|uniref:Uncharacterized protein n=1 Tax=Edhazardia aedis (strain USNM 41457) TaxID=1003232 RepID=J8ZR59_EDHAE|nr:hypothetical protein EDEG_03388 [Edhazardia aedis USNM 41457]|eukprot:EJW02173.1 hypothetical protein EDEG_03388 [Edhazardia aedis USNM 41457]
MLLLCEVHKKISNSISNMKIYTKCITFLHIPYIKLFDLLLITIFCPSKITLFYLIFMSIFRVFVNPLDLLFYILKKIFVKKNSPTMFFKINLSIVGSSCYNAILI